MGVAINPATLIDNRVRSKIEYAGPGGVTGVSGLFCCFWWHS